MLRLARVLLNGFAEVADGVCEGFCNNFELLNVLGCVSSSSVLPVVPSDPALKGSSAEPSLELAKDRTSAETGVAGVRDGAKKPSGMPFSPSEVAEWGDIIRTVLTAFVLRGRGTSEAIGFNIGSLGWHVKAS